MCFSFEHQRSEDRKRLLPNLLTSTSLIPSSLAAVSGIHNEDPTGFRFRSGSYPPNFSAGTLFSSQRANSLPLRSKLATAQEQNSLPLRSKLATAQEQNSLPLRSKTRYRSGAKLATAREQNSLPFGASLLFCDPWSTSLAFRQTKTPVRRAGESRTALGPTRPSCRKATPPVSSSDTTGRRAGGGHANVLVLRRAHSLYQGAARRSTTGIGGPIPGVGQPTRREASVAARMAE